MAKIFEILGIFPRYLILINYGLLRIFQSTEYFTPILVKYFWSSNLSPFWVRNASQSLVVVIFAEMNVPFFQGTLLIKKISLI